MKFLSTTCLVVLLALGVLGHHEDRQASRLDFNDAASVIESFQRNSPALNQLFAQSVGQGWKYGQIAANGIKAELSPKSLTLLKEVRKIATQRAINVRNQYQQLSKSTQENLQGAAPLVKQALNNYPTFQPIVDIIRKQIPNGFLATLTS